MLSIYILYFIIYDLKKMFREPPPQKKKFQFVLDKNYCSYATTKILLSLALIFHKFPVCVSFSHYLSLPVTDSQLQFSEKPTTLVTISLNSTLLTWRGSRFLKRYS